MLRWRFCNYSDAYIIVSGNIAVPSTGAAAAPNNTKKYDN